jgi:ankyrin repeat protein
LSNEKATRKILLYLFKPYDLSNGMKIIPTILLILLILPQTSFSAPIHDAAEKGDLATVKKLVSGGISPNSKDESGNTPLHWASMSGNDELISFLLEKGTDVNAINELSVSALILAMYTKNYGSARLLISKGANPNIRDSDKSTALSMAVNSEHWDLVRQFITNGADPNLPDENGIPPLARVTEDVGDTMIKWLVEHGADVNVRGHLGMTPLHRIVTWGDLSLAEYIIQGGADLNAIDDLRLTPLYYAIESENLDMVQLLLKEGADPDIIWRDFSNSSHPKTALAFARSHQDREFGNNVEELLIAADADLYIPPDPCITLQQVLSMNRLGSGHVLIEFEGKKAKIFVLTVLFWEYGSSGEETGLDDYDAVAVIDINKFNLAPMVLFNNGCSLNVDSGFIGLKNVPPLIETTELISTNAEEIKIKKALQEGSFWERKSQDFDEQFINFRRMLHSQGIR